jgi:hypothetical protein
MTYQLRMPASADLSNYLRSIGRLASVSAYGISFLIVHHVQPVAAKAYNDLCASQGMTFGEGESVGALIIFMILIAAPLVFTRSNGLIVVNFTIGLLTLLGAHGLLSTAGDTPYECFTQAGTYEDHTSGLEGFGFWILIAIFFSYVVLLIDLIVWAAKKGLTLRAARCSR